MGPFEPTRADGLASFRPPNDRPGRFLRRAAMPPVPITAGEEAADVAGGLFADRREVEPSMAAASMRSVDAMCVCEGLLLVEAACASLLALRLAKP
jgi:hypothetical protein